MAVKFGCSAFISIGDVEDFDTVITIGSVKSTVLIHLNEGDLVAADTIVIEGDKVDFTVIKDDEFFKGGAVAVILVVEDTAVTE